MVTSFKHYNDVTDRAASVQMTCGYSFFIPRVVTGVRDRIISNG